MRRAAATLATQFAILGLAAVAAAGSIEITPDDLRIYGDTPLEHTIYLGSDSNFHYFAWTRGKASGRWRILKASMPFACEFPFEEREAILVLDDSGLPQPYVPGCVAGAPAT